MAKIDDELKTKFVHVKHRFITNLIFTSNWFQNKYLEFLKPYGLSIQQFNILRILRGAEEEWVSMNKIKALMIEQSPNATRLSDKLLNKGLIDRKRSESDRRIVYLALNKKGNELLANIDNNDGGDHMDFMNRLSDEEAKQISDVLDRIRG